MFVRCLFIGFSLFVVSGVFAQEGDFSYESTLPSVTVEDDAFGEPEAAPIQTYYELLLQKYNDPHSLDACEEALQLYGAENDEFAARLLTKMADNATLIGDFTMATMYYNQILETEFKEDHYSRGIIAEWEKVKAWAGLRQIAFLQEDYAKALEYHEKHEQALKSHSVVMARNNKAMNDRLAASIYQGMGKSETALALLAPYAFGNGPSAGGGINKTSIQHLVELLATKYPKRQFKKQISKLYKQIGAEMQGDQYVFYITVFENKIYFPADYKGYQVATGQLEMGRAVAYYQNRFLNSYFFECMANVYP